MADNPLDALHQVNTATNDVLQGYATMLERAEPEIAGTIAHLTALHRDHAAALSARLADLGHDGADDTSFRGTMNSVAVTLRDWVTGLDDGSLAAVERGERALLDIFDDALKNWSTRDDPATGDLLERQYHEINEAISGLAVPGDIA